MTDNFPGRDGPGFNPLQSQKNVSDAFFLCAYVSPDTAATDTKIEHPWKSPGNKSEGVDEGRGVYRTVFGRDELPIKTSTFPIGHKAKEAAADYKTGEPCYRHTVYKDGATRTLKFSEDATVGKMRIADKNGESTVTVYPSGVEFKRTSKDDNQSTKFNAGTYGGKAKLEHRTKGNLVFSWEFDVTSGLTMKNHGALDRPYSATEITTDGHKIQYSIGLDGEKVRSTYTKTKLTDAEQKEFKALYDLMDQTVMSRSLPEKMKAPEMLKQLQRWGSYDFLSGEQRDTKKIPSLGQTKSTPLTDGLGAGKPKESSDEKSEAPKATPERAEDKRVKTASDAVLAMEKNDYKYLAVKAALIDTYDRTAGGKDTKMEALREFVKWVNGDLKGRGSVSIEPLGGQLAFTVKEVERARDADFVISMRINYGKKNFDPIAFPLGGKK